MKKIVIYTVLFLTTNTCLAQKITFASGLIEERVKDILDLSEGEDVMQIHVDTMSVVDLSGLALEDLNDILWFKNVRELDLSYNNITDIAPLRLIDSLHMLNLSGNQLDNIDQLLFSRSDSINVNVTNNYIFDFSSFFRPSHCLFTLTGMGQQLVRDAPSFIISEFYSSADEKGCVVEYRGYSNIAKSFFVQCGTEKSPITLNGESQTIAVPGNPKTTSMVCLTYGEQSVTTYVVPSVDYSVDAGKTIILETGLPEDYRLSYAYAIKGTVEIEGTTMKYTAPETAVSDIIHFTYYEGQVLKGSSYFYINRSDVNGDGYVDFKDIVEIVNAIAGKPLSEKYNENAADVNKDGKIDIADIIMLAKSLITE